jgi:hypothetical protein
MIHLKTGEGIPSVLLLFVTKCIILLQNIVCILAETPFMVLRRYIMLIRSFSSPRVDLYYRFFIFKNRQCLKIAFVIVGGY